MTWSAVAIRFLGVVLLAARIWAAVPEAVAEAARGADLSPRRESTTLPSNITKRPYAWIPKLPGLYLNLGLAYFKSKRLPEAAKAFEEAVRADGSSFQARALLGMSYYGCARYADAAAQLKLASAGTA